MSNNILEIEELIKQFSKLPGLGPKSAKRIILKLISNKENMIKPLAKSLANVYKTIIRCGTCGNLRVAQNKCICEENNNNYRRIIPQGEELVINGENNMKLITYPSHERKRIAGKKKVNEFRDGFLILIKMIKLLFKY